MLIYSLTYTFSRMQNRVRKTKEKRTECQKRKKVRRVEVFSSIATFLKSRNDRKHCSGVSAIRPKKK